MKLTEFFLTEMDREVERSRRALENVLMASTTGSRTRSR